jgi:hypothetical protein
MPATALESARLAASTYADACLARRRAYVTLPVDDPDSDGILGRLRDVTRRAFAEFVKSLAELHDAGDEAQALALVLDVQDKTQAARTPITITISEDYR